MTFYSFLFLFFAYSFLGWVGEVLYTAVTRRRYQDRGVLSGPLCILYGIGAHLISFALRDLSNDSWFFLAVFSAVYATVIEWVAGHILERTSHTRWWDYSDRKWNLDGYICLSASVVWGALGLVTVKWLVPLLMRLYQLVPAGLAHVLLWIFAILLVIDLLGTALTLGGLRRAVLEGDVETGSVMSGQVAGMLHEIKPLRQIFEKLYTGSQAVLKATEAAWR